MAHTADPAPRDNSFAAGIGPGRRAAAETTGGEDRLRTAS